MPSNSEMYERGADDAEHDELNAFYYQHYYFYRRGYDDTRRQTRRGGGPPPLLLMVGLALALAGGVWWFFGRGPVAGEAQVVAAMATAIPATATSVPPTVTPQPAAAPTTTPTTLAVGGRARVVNLNGAPLRARETPGLSALVVARIPEGAEVILREGPVERDGYIWWNIEAEGARGWVAGGTAEGASFLAVIP